MKRLLPLIALLLLIPLPTHAQANIQVLASGHQSRFPTEIIFSLEAQSSATIEAITLFFWAGERDILNYTYPQFTPGLRVSAQYRLDTQRNYIPPSTEVSYYWEIADNAGQRWQTEATTFSYEDLRFRWQELSQAGVNLYWYQGSPAFAQDLLNLAVTERDRLFPLVGAAEDGPIKIFLYQSKADLDPALPRRSPTFESQVITAGMELSPQILVLLASHPELEQTLSHELMHMAVNRVVTGPYSDLPDWLDEGLAMNAQPQVGSLYSQALDQAVRGDRLISLRSLSSSTGDPSQINLYYGEAHSVVKFLLQGYGWDKMRELLRVFKEGSSYDDALRQVYGLDMDGLNAQWRSSLGLGPTPTTSPPSIGFGEALRLFALVAITILTMFLLRRRARGSSHEGL